MGAGRALPYSVQNRLYLTLNNLFDIMKYMKNKTRSHSAVPKEVFLEYLKENLTNIQIAKELEMSSSAISYYIKKYGLTSNNPMISPWTKKEDLILMKLYKSTPINILYKNLKIRSKSSIRRRAFELGLKKDVSIYKHCSPQSSLSILLEDEFEAYYWVGFLMADGHIRHTSKTIHLKLSMKDLEHIKKFAKYTKIKNISIIEKKPCSKGLIKTGGKYCCIQVGDVKSISTLIKKFNFKPRKTYNPPDIKVFKRFTNNQLLSFIIGFIDGDGNIETPYLRKLPSGNSSLTNTRITIECHKNWLEFFKFLTNTLKNITKIDTPTAYLSYRTNREPMACIKISKIDILNKLKQFILDNNLPVLERKWDKIPTEEV